MNTENGDERHEAMPSTLVLDLPKAKLARFREGEFILLTVDGLTIPARKHAGQLVLAGDTEIEHSGEHLKQHLLRAQTHFLRVALTERLAKLIDRLADKTIAEVLGQDDVGTFTTLSFAIAEEGRDTSETDKARLRGVQARLDLIGRAGGTLTVEFVAKMLGVSEEAIRKRLRARTLIGLKSGREYRIPAIQFHNGQEVAGLRDVLKAMPIKSPLMRLNWLMSPEPRLDNREPIEVLREGDNSDKVIEAAQLYGEQGGA